MPEFKANTLATTGDGVDITDNTLRIEAGEGSCHLVLNGVDITGMINNTWYVDYNGETDEAGLTVTFPVRVVS